MIKLLGPGEYVAKSADGDLTGSFWFGSQRLWSLNCSLIDDISNLITQRLLIAALENKPAPYSKSELGVLAAHCTIAEDAANKVERQSKNPLRPYCWNPELEKSSISIVTGASQKGNLGSFANCPGRREAGLWI